MKKKLKMEEELRVKHEKEQEEQYKKLKNKIVKYIPGNYLNDDASECITFSLDFGFTQKYLGAKKKDYIMLKIDKQKNNGLIKNKILFKSYYYDRFKIEHIDITNDNDIEKITLYLSRDIYEKITFLIYKDHIECFSDGKIDEKQTAYGKIKYAFKNFIKSSENDKLIY